MRKINGSTGGHTSRMPTGEQFDSRRHSGFTLLEVLVVSAIISLLVSLALPAMLSARSTSRRASCLNQLRQLSLALTARADQDGRLPAAGLFARTGRGPYHTWVTSILPQLDQAQLTHRYDFARFSSDAENLVVIRTPLAVLACPDDISLVAGQGNLSYTVNGGIGWTIPIDCPASVHASDEEVTIMPVDLNGDGKTCGLQTDREASPRDRDILKDLSLFFVENWPPRSGTERYHRWGDITDGLSTTLMLAENVRAGYDSTADSHWGTPDPLRTMFFVSSTVCRAGSCQKETIDLTRANSHSHLDSSRESLNAALRQAEGTAPWPSSGHPGLVHVAWVDGHASALSDQIDGAVYFAMVTPRGGAQRNFFAEPVVSGAGP